MKRRIGILTSGGDCPGLNAAIRKVYSLYHEPPRRCQSPESAVRTIAEAVMDLYKDAALAAGCLK